MNIIKGDLIQAMLNAEYEVGLHGCNCMSIQKAGLAAQMVEYFRTDSVTYFFMESLAETNRVFKHPANKLGCIDWAEFYVNGERAIYVNDLTRGRRQEPVVTIVNCYTQIAPGQPGKYGIPLDYDALTLCLRKVNSIFAGKTVALPLIGGGLGKGDRGRIVSIIDSELVKCTPTILIPEKDWVL